jgi:hypothetical protein
LKAKIYEPERHSKNWTVRDLYMGISDFEKGHPPRPSIVTDEKGDMVADCHSTVARWRNHFSQLLNVLWVNYVRQTEIHISELLLRLKWI